MDGWPAGLFVCVCTISSVHGQFHVRWNHVVCPSTVPSGTVTEIRDNKREREMQIRGSGLSEVTLPKE